MSISKIIIIFGIILVIFAGIVVYQLDTESENQSISQSPSSTIKINDHVFKVELAQTPQEQEMGLSGRDSLAEDQGMLFLFEEEGYYNFWMKNMKFPIDIIFINDDRIVSIIKNAQPPESENVNPQILKPEGVIDKVLEIKAGLSEEYGFKKGDRVEIKTAK